MIDQFHILRSNDKIIPKKIENYSEVKKSVLGMNKHKQSEWLKKQLIALSKQGIINNLMKFLIFTKFNIVVMFIESQVLKPIILKNIKWLKT